MYELFNSEHFDAKSLAEVLIEIENEDMAEDFFGEGGG